LDRIKVVIKILKTASRGFLQKAPLKETFLKFLFFIIATTKKKAPSRRSLKNFIE
jgi:hypothetical protein